MKGSFFGAHCELERFHFVGLGGIGMSALAEILAGSGCRVSGSDLHGGPILDRLNGLGVRTAVGHDADNLGDAQAVVFSTAVPADNPELQEARKRGLPCLHRSEMLAELMRFKAGIAVSGTHGKTTVTAMIAQVFVAAGLDPTVVVGARVPALGGNARLGRGPHLVAEADESDRSFLRLPSVCSVVTNIDRDHMDVYRDLDDLRESFLRFMDQVPFHGKVIACVDDAEVRALVGRTRRLVFSYGLSEAAQLRAAEPRLGPSEAVYECLHGGRSLGQVRLPVAGAHNVVNSLAAVAAALWAGIPFAEAARALAGFTSAERRMQWKGETPSGVAVIDDYAHHPAEIEATLAACRELGRPLVVVFQPHRFSRTEHLMEEMGRCFKAARQLYLLDVYAAGEAPRPGVDSRRLASRIARVRPVVYVPEERRMLDILRSETSAGDVILTMGAGDVWKIGEKFLEENSQQTNS